MRGRVMVSTSAQMQFDVMQDHIVLARNFVFDQRSATWTEELPEYRAIVDIAPVIADVRVGGVDIGITLHALILVVAARESQVCGASRACGMHAILFATQLEAVRQVRKQPAVNPRNVSTVLAIRLSSTAA